MGLPRAPVQKGDVVTWTADHPPGLQGRRGVIAGIIDDPNDASWVAIVEFEAAPEAGPTTFNIHSEHDGLWRREPYDVREPHRRSP